MTARGALSIDPDHVHAHVVRGWAIAEMFAVRRDPRMFRDAQIEFGIARRLDSECGWVDTGEGTLTLLTGELDRAQFLLERAVKRNPRLPYAHNQLGLLYLGQDDLDTAEREFREALRLYPRIAWAAANLGGVQLRRKRWRDAEGALKRAIDNEPRNAYCYFRLGEAFSGQGKLTSAARAYAVAVQLEPGNPEFQRRLDSARRKLVTRSRR